MKLKGIIFEDFVNYKVPSMVLEFPKCSFKCDKECGKPVCQNGTLANEPDIDADISNIVQRYVNNPITEAVILQGLEPIDSFEDICNFITALRKQCDDDVVIYTGYRYAEIDDKINLLASLFKNIVVKFGRYIPDCEPHYDNVLGVNLASNNQFAVRIS